jgi:hypothetical protein
LFSGVEYRVPRPQEEAAVKLSRVLCLVVGLTLGLAFAVNAAEEAGENKEAPKKPQRKSMLERFDTDGNGTISLEEYKAGMAQIAEKRFKVLDRNADGELDKEELRKGRRFRRRRPGKRGQQAEPAAAE